MFIYVSYLTLWRSLSAVLAKERTSLQIRVPRALL